MISIQSIHHNAEFWSEPMKYDPTRFLKSSTPPVPFTFIPFIDGPRNCLGQYLALLESKIVISLLANRYTLTHETDGLKGDPRHRYIVPIIPSGDINVRVERR
jgi:cytochrome P450